MRQTAVSVKNLYYSYTSYTNLFEDFSLQIYTGQRFGIFGPNGAGKTTLISIMTGILNIKEGMVNIFNLDIKKDKKKAQLNLGIVPQDFSFYDMLTPMENLEFFGIWTNVDKKHIKSRSEEILHILGLYHVRKKKVKYFSGGMKRRINLAIGVIHKPKILFLDEPTTGIDVQSRSAILDFLHNLNENGTTLVYTSHQLHEAENLCNGMALIDAGQILAQGELTDLVDGKSGGLEKLYMELTGKAYRD